MSTSRSPNHQDLRFPMPLDRAALGTLLVLLVFIGGLLLSGYRGKPQVRSMNWQDRQVGSQDTTLTLTFSRPMDPESVEKNLKITPPIPGRFSWAGRRMVYTLDRPAPYGQTFEVSLENAQDRFRSGNFHEPMAPFKASFQTRDRFFAYIGAEGDEVGRLVLVKLDKENPQKTLLTPATLTVFDFKPYPLGDRILISATKRTDPNVLPPLIEQELYNVTTGIQVRSVEGEIPVNAGAGQLTPVLNNQDYQNLKFDLSANGKIVVVQRVNRKNPTLSSPWVVRINTDQPPEELKLEKPTGNFLITPDSSSIVATQGLGVSVLPLNKAEATDRPDFLPKFGNVLAMSQDGSSAAFVKFNTDYTRSLFVVTNQGQETEVFKTTGSILKGQFSGNRQYLFALLTDLLGGETYKEQPYIAAIDLLAIRQGKPVKEALYPLLRLPNQREVQMSLAPDDGSILIDQRVPAVTTDGKPTETSQLWLVPLSDDPSKPNAPGDLGLTGSQPKWLP